MNRRLHNDGSRRRRAFTTHTVAVEMPHAPGSRRTSALAAAVAVLLGVGLAPALTTSPAAAAAPSGHQATTTLRGFSKAPRSVLLGGTVVDKVQVRPKAHRTVRIQARKPGSRAFVTLSSVRSSRTGDFQATYRPTKAGTWQFRLLLPATAKATRFVSASRAITATTDVTAPGSVTALTVVQAATGSDLDLSWKNPSDADFAGVMIRRTTGPVAPASPTAGVLVASTNAATSFTDTGLLGDTTYSYALFAFDQAQNKAPGTTGSAMSGAATTAVLTINGSTGPTANDTVNVSEVYDISTGTHAGRNLTMASGTLDYGDSSAPEGFVGDPSTWVPAGHQYATTGTFTATLTVVDSASHPVSTTIQVHVVTEPSATITVDPLSVLEKNKPVRFLVTSATPASTSFTDWDAFSGGGDNFQSGPGKATTFDITFATPGTYTVTFEGFNDAGGLATATVDVVVIDAPPPPAP